MWQNKYVNIIQAKTYLSSINFIVEFFLEKNNFFKCLIIAFSTFYIYFKNK